MKSMSELSGKLHEFMICLDKAGFTPDLVQKIINSKNNFVAEKMLTAGKYAISDQKFNFGNVFSKNKANLVLFKVKGKDVHQVTVAEAANFIIRRNAKLVSPGEMTEVINELQNQFPNVNGLIYVSGGEGYSFKRKDDKFHVINLRNSGDYLLGGEYIAFIPMV